MSKVLKKIIISLSSIILTLAILAGILLIVVTHDYSGAKPVSVLNCTNPHISKTGKPMISAHRSGAGIAPENTMMAFKNIIENQDRFQIDIFEFDLQITKDDEIILLHDETLDRTSNSREIFKIKNAKVHNYTYEELRKLNMGENFTNSKGEKPYQGLKGDALLDDLKIVRLDDVLDYLDNYKNFNFIMEIKDDGALGKKAADRIYEILLEKNVLQRTIIGTFHNKITKYLDQYYPDVYRSASVKEVIGFYLDSLLNIKRKNSHYKFVALQIPDEDYVVKLGTTRLINYAHKHNIAVQYWTINSKKDVKDLAKKGADAIMSDYPDMVYETLNSL